MVVQNYISCLLVTNSLNETSETSSCMYTYIYLSLYIYTHHISIVPSLYITSYVNTVKLICCIMFSLPGLIAGGCMPNHLMMFDPRVLWTPNKICLSRRRGIHPILPFVSFWHIWIDTFRLHSGKCLH